LGEKILKAMKKGLPVPKGAFSASPLPFPLNGAQKGFNLKGNVVASNLGNAAGGGGGGGGRPSANELPAWFQHQHLHHVGAPSAQSTPMASESPLPPMREVVLDMSPRGKHAYPPPTPWNCNHIAAWMGLVLGFIALAVALIAWLPGHSHPHTEDDFDRSIGGGLIGGREAEAPHENYVAFRFEAETGPTRWPKTGVIAGLNLEDIVATRLCCVVGTQQYLVCDSSQGLTNNLGISYVVRNVADEHGAHLLMTAASTDMAGSHCIFSWQTRIHQHDKAALVVGKGAEAKETVRRVAHVHAGKRGK
jgi:hypothetical protein